MLNFISALIDGPDTRRHNPEDNKVKIKYVSISFSWSWKAK